MGFDNLPEGWSLNILGEICKTTSGGTPNRKNSSYYNGTIPWIKSGELNNGRINCSEEKISQEALENSSAKIFPKGTLLIALYGATIGKLGILDIDAATNQAICGIFENNVLSTKYLFYYLLFQRPNLIKQGVGGAQPNISQTILKQVHIPYPDRIQQDNIVLKLDELLSELDKSISELQNIKKQIAVYQRLCLRDAFNDLEDERVELGKCIQHIEAGKSFRCNEKTPSNTEYGIVKVSAVTWGDFDEEESKTCPDNKFIENIRIQNGDFLFSRANTIQLVGACVIVDQVKKNLMLSDKILRFKFSDDIDPYYILYYLRSIHGRNQIESLSTGNQESMRNIGQERIKRITIPLSSLDRQHEIVAKVEEQISVIRDVERTIESTLLKSQTLRQSILKQAFEGQLV